ncbi:MAG: HAMP domain-containing protein [Candidatus Thiodiazotropha lotti]|uniref:adenylate/guanylate cyclase domain-containing protein n=1 Tax=Candidatus Thiodiazotropha endoloripes TaxID=1818881 RepID=UPI000B12FF63|nr:adenylate/guanylate cyclase domain-containing protein [Candidatus Thiodiazotropha endoloripes]MCG7897289.1 HAMP domain-containing protein [Candidatus Thiodiazotropha weberae]MCG7993037.1 HAMP domain-containing protein [Candidatus Thiodiazotropha lotti]MCG7902570.1 HAMP domain-containing protein [Candidatus Thiodiazotropha weberae]MCG7913604.1 HAMP domain-containing protein [Candidatus Thiodiazotropha weberae]MCG8000171.1 HAMP domain-containing protein [Candidatus Thiodiazotropha lotti]
MLNWLVQLFRKAPVPISIKWTIYIGTLITMVMGILGWFLITQQTSFHMREVRGFGEVLVEQLAHSASEPLLADDQFNLQGLVSRQTQNNNVVGAAIVPSEKPWVISGNVPHQLPTTDELTPMIWSWRDEDNRRYPAITFFSPIHFRDVIAGHAVITLDRAFLDRNQKRTIRIISFATIGLILIAAILSYVLSKRLSRPITLLAQAGHQPEAGMLISQGDEDRKDEIGQVYAHFERMSAGMLEKRQVEDALSRYVSPVVADKILSNLSQPRLANQEMEGSVLFCDIVGFTQLSEDLPADEVASLLNLYLGAIADAAHRCRGVVDKFIGDSAMILFGVPEADNEHGQQAVRCAWLIQALVRHINKQRRQEGKEPIMLRIGINSGVMLAGNIGIPDRLEYTVVGDSVNLASRLCGAAPADGIMMSETTAEFPGVKEMVELHRQPELKIRGKKNRVSPSIAGTPSREFGQWLMRTMAYILNKHPG